MKITAFNPLILTKNADTYKKLFEDLGFEQRHNKTGEKFDSFSMKNADGFRVDVTQADKIPQDMVTIRMNVDNFEEAYELLSAQGFTNINRDKVTDTGSSKAALMVSPSGVSISLTQHIKD